MTLFIGRTLNILGAAPKLHLSRAPLHTCCGISNILFDEPAKVNGTAISPNNCHENKTLFDVEYPAVAFPHNFLLNLALAL